MDRQSCIIAICVIFHLLLTPTTAGAQDGLQVETVKLSKSFPNEIQNQVSVEHPRIYKIDTNIIGFDEEITRIEVIAWINEKAPVQFPVSITIIQKDETSLISLPRSLPAAGGAKKVSHKTASKMLCIPKHKNGSDNDPERFFRLFVSSGSIQAVRFTIKILIDSPQIALNTPFNASVDPITPLSNTFIKVPVISNASPNVLIRVNSDNDHCMGVTVQQPQCHINEDGSDLGLPGGSWNIFSRNGVIRVDTRDYLQGFRLRSVVFKDDSLCGGLTDTSPGSLESRSKFVTFTIEDDLGISIENPHFWVVVAFPLALSICVAIIFGCTYIICYRSNLRYDKRVTVCRTESYAKRMSLRILTVKKKDKSDYGKWTFIISLFFAITLIQQSIFEKMTADEHGVHGACVYDSFCSHPVWIFKDFNHLWSNVSYLLLGLFFVLFTALKKSIRDTHKSEEEEGVALHTGLYYSMGFSLILYGVVNASYHTCPSKSKFQYELIYMSFVATICCLKIVELRRQRSFKVVSACSILLVCFIISEVGVAFERYLSEWDDLFLGFRILIAVIQGIFCFYLSVYFIYYGYPVNRKAGTEGEEVPLRDVGISEPRHGQTSYTPGTADSSQARSAEATSFMRSIGDIPRCCFCLPKLWHWKIPKSRPERILFVLMFLGLNGYLIYLSLSMSYCLYVFLVILSNFGLFLFFYFTMKIIIGEFACGWLNLACFIFLIMGLLFGAGSGYYFLENMAEWTQPATNARVGNEECISFLPYQFYSKHDAWHILSAHTLFFFFMVLLAIDDGVENVNMEFLMSF